MNSWASVTPEFMCDVGSMCTAAYHRTTDSHSRNLGKCTYVQHVIVLSAGTYPVPLKTSSTVKSSCKLSALRTVCLCRKLTTVRHLIMQLAVNLLFPPCCAEHESQLHHWPHITHDCWLDLIPFDPTECFSCPSPQATEQLDYGSKSKLRIYSTVSKRHFSDKSFP